MFKLNPHTLLARTENGAVTLDSDFEFIKMLNIELPYDLVTLLLGIQTRDTQARIHKNHVHECS